MREPLFGHKGIFLFPYQSEPDTELAVPGVPGLYQQQCRCWQVAGASPAPQNMSALWCCLGIFVLSSWKAFPRRAFGLWLK